MVRSYLALVIFFSICLLTQTIHIRSQQIPTSSFPKQPNFSQFYFQQDCTQKYPRIFFRPQPNQYLIKFNTYNQCNNSYVTIIQNNTISRYNCQSQQLKIQQKTLYLRYIQNCIIMIKDNFQFFNYSVHGNSFNYQQSYYDERKYQISSYRVNIMHADNSLNMIVVADWGPLQIRPYQPIYPSLVSEIRQNTNKIQAILLIGDVAYDLLTNQCQQYQLFMSQLQAVSPYYPIIPIFGNHERYPLQNQQIFKLSFESYNLSQNNRVQSYNFWNFKLITFDPFLQIYGISTEQKYKIMKNNLLYQLNNIKSQQFIILTSHYPIICSQKVFHCQRTLQALSNLYQEISQFNLVDLYLGAHMHQYQRIVPYKNGNFDISRKGPYQKGEMPSIVEGVAGCDVGIIDEDYPTQNFSISHSYNQTGYGILNVYDLLGSPSAKYTHYVTPSKTQTKIFDQVFISTKTQQLIQKKRNIR